MFNTNGKGHIPYLFGGGFGVYSYPGVTDWRSRLDGLFMMDDVSTEDTAHVTIGSQTLVIIMASAKIII